MKKPILISVGSEPPPQQLYYYAGDKRFPIQDVDIINPHVRQFFNNNPNTMNISEEHKSFRVTQERELLYGTEIPRRNIVTRHTEAEATIHKAIQDVEHLGASPELTAIAMKLTEAFNMLADHTDETLLRIAEKEQEQEDDNRLRTDRV